MGGRRNGGSTKVGSDLQLKMWLEAVSESAEMFLLKCWSLMAGLINLWSVANVVWFRVVRKPLDDTSKASTLHL